jgi:hypothetical protein
MVLADGAGTPLGAPGETESPAEVQRLEPTLRNKCIGSRHAERRRPRRLIADRGYDRNAVRSLLVKRAIEPIIPARRNNGRATPQDGR